MIGYQHGVGLQNGPDDGGGDGIFIWLDKFGVVIF